MKEILGVNIIFSTLWSNISETRRWVIQQSLSDFKVINCTDRLLNVDDYNLLHQKSVEFLQNALNEKSNKKTIVVTHHAPTFINYPEKYANSNINEAFASELEKLIEDSNIDYWIYGHHHVNLADFEIGNTKLITNQLGYIKYNENTGFNDKAIILI
ncbi:MAG: metallophosphoesterase [Flavobacterium sp.]